MKCIKRHTLLAYLDDELPAHLKSLVERHLRGCRACETELQRLKQEVQAARARLAELEPQEISVPSFEPTRVDHRQTRSLSRFLRSLIPQPPSSVGWLRPVTIAVLAVAILLVGVNTLFREPEEELISQSTTYTRGLAEHDPNRMWHERQLIIEVSLKGENTRSRIVTSKNRDNVVRESYTYPDNQLQNPENGG